MERSYLYTEPAPYTVPVHAVNVDTKQEPRLPLPMLRSPPYSNQVLRTTQQQRKKSKKMWMYRHQQDLRILEQVDLDLHSNNSLEPVRANPGGGVRTMPNTTIWRLFTM